MPEVCLSVAVHEDLLPTVVWHLGGRPLSTSKANVAAPWESWREAPNQAMKRCGVRLRQVDQLRRSMNSLQALLVSKKPFSIV